jgi:hypothetical protein
MEDAPDFQGISDVDEEKPVVGDTEPEFTFKKSSQNLLAASMSGPRRPNASTRGKATLVVGRRPAKWR